MEKNEDFFKASMDCFVTLVYIIMPCADNEIIIPLRRYQGEDYGWNDLVSRCVFIDGEGKVAAPICAHHKFFSLTIDFDVATDL
jgi:hypothetical protein